MIDPLSAIQPIVLVGGRSRRFGSNKLLEPLPSTDRPLVSVSIDALRNVFGPRVATVGECAAEVRAAADRVIEDVHPGVGPIGGIVSALRGSDNGIFVTSGDLPGLDARTILRIIEASAGSPGSLAVLAETDRVHSCLGLYRAGALPHLEARLTAGRHQLRDALPSDSTLRVSVAVRKVVNINDQNDWVRWLKLKNT